MTDPDPSSYTRAGNLRAPLSSLVGRNEDKAEVAALLARHRLVTLVGSPGVGKTRLGLQVAIEVAERFPDGAWLVDLATVDDPHLVRLVASKFGLAKAPANTMDSLTNRLMERRILLVLDNCERVVSACATLAEALLATCRSLTILATSRERLGLAGETQWRVSALTVPPLDERLPELAASDSVRLFVDRVPEAGFNMTESRATSIADICRHLDGVPLEIEFAANRLNGLSPEEVAVRLDQRLHFLVTGERHPLDRHRSLRAALDTSYDLLSPSERLLLRHLSAFAGPFTLGAATEISKEAISPDDVLQSLVSLVTKSLVVADSGGRETQYRLLESIRFYSREKLSAAGEEVAVRDAHARWCAGMVRQSDVEHSNRAKTIGAARCREVRLRHADMRDALEWSLAREDCDLPLKLTGGLAPSWAADGQLAEGRAWLERALSAHAGSDTSRAKALWGLGYIASRLGDFLIAESAAEEALRLAQRGGDCGVGADASSLLGLCRIFTDPVAAPDDLRQAVTLARQSKNVSRLAGSLGLLGCAQAVCAELDAASESLEEGAARGLQVNDGQGVGIALVGVGYVSLQRGESERARMTLEQGLAAARLVGDHLWTAAALACLAELATGQGHQGRAERLATEGEGLARLHARPMQAPCLAALGYAYLAKGDHDHAASLFEQVLSCAVAGGHGGVLARAMIGLGWVRFQCGNPGAGVALIEEAVEAAEGNKDWVGTAHGLQSLGKLASWQHDGRSAMALHVQAMCLRAEVGHRPGIAASLESIAGLAIEEGCLERASRLLGAAESLRVLTGWARTSEEDARYTADLGELEKAFPLADRMAAWECGWRMPLQDAVEEACQGKKQRLPSPSGWAGLTRSERQVIHLVALGLTNPEVGEQLFISPRTVQTHLAHVFAKLSLRSRQELAREVRRRQLPKSVDLTASCT